MGREFVSRFEVIPRRTRAQDLVPLIRRCSRRFKIHVAAGDTRAMESTSREAWDALTNLFEVLRNEQDQGRLPSTFMNPPTAYFANEQDCPPQYGNGVISH